MLRKEDNVDCFRHGEFLSQGEYPQGNPQPSRTPKLQAAKATNLRQWQRVLQLALQYVTEVADYTCKNAALVDALLLRK